MKRDRDLADEAVVVVDHGPDGKPFVRLTNPGPSRALRWKGWRTRGPVSPVTVRRIQDFGRESAGH